MAEPIVIGIERTQVCKLRTVELGQFVVAQTQDAQSGEWAIDAEGGERVVIWQNLYVSGLWSENHSNG